MDDQTKPNFGEPIRLKGNGAAPVWFAILLQSGWMFFLFLHAIWIPLARMSGSWIVVICTAESIVLAGSVAFFQYLRFRGATLVADDRGMRVEHGIVTWSSTWEDLKFKRAGLLIKVWVPIDSLGQTLTLRNFTGPRFSELNRAISRLANATSSPQEPGPWTRAFIKMLVAFGVAASIAGLTGRPNWDSVTYVEGAIHIDWLRIIPTLAGITFTMSFAFIGMFQMLLLFARLESKKKSVQVEGDPLPTLRDFQKSDPFPTPVTLRPGIRYRYVAPRALIRNYQSGALWISAISAVVIPAAWLNPRGLTWESASGVGAIALIIAAIAAFAEVTQRRWRAVAFDQFEVDSNDNLIVIRNGQRSTYSGKAKRSGNPDRCANPWGHWHERYRSDNGSSYRLDRRYLTPVEPEPKPGSTLAHG